MQDRGGDVYKTLQMALKLDRFLPIPTRRTHLQCLVMTIHTKRIAMCALVILLGIGMLS